MSHTTRNRHNTRAKLFKRLNSGTAKASRKHQRLERRLLKQAKAVVSQQVSP